MMEGSPVTRFVSALASRLMDKRWLRQSRQDRRLWNLASDGRHFHLPILVARLRGLAFSPMADVGLTVRAARAESSGSLRLRREKQKPNSEVTTDIYSLTSCGQATLLSASEDIRVWDLVHARRQSRHLFLRNS